MDQKNTSYLKIVGQLSDDLDFILLNPHGSIGHEFLGHFFSNSPVFEQGDIAPHWLEFLELEKDRGATELTEATHNYLVNHGFRVASIHSKYPRGLLDAGRRPESCLGPYVLKLLNDGLLSRLKQLHEVNFTWIIETLAKAHAKRAIVLDIHTMASHSPRDPLHLSDMDIYKGQYMKGPFSDERKIDIISKCSNNSLLGLESLKVALESFLTDSLFQPEDIAHNRPYLAEPRYTMYHALMACGGLAIDFPKHLVARDYTPAKLASFEVCNTKVQLIAAKLADALIHAKDSECQ